MSEAEQVKFKAVLDAENTTSIHDALNVAQNLWRYEFTAEPDTADAFFKKYILENTSTEFDSRWLENLLPRNEADKLLGRLGATLPITALFPPETAIYSSPCRMTSRRSKKSRNRR